MFVSDYAPGVLRMDVGVNQDILSGIWSQDIDSSLRLVAWAPSEDLFLEVKPYAESVARLLKAHLSAIKTDARRKTALKVLVKEIDQQQPDLLVFSGPETSTFGEWVSEPLENKLIRKLPASLLVAKQPRWPLSKILLILHNERVDESAVDWAIRFARPSDAFITILPVIPPTPMMYSSKSRMQHNLPILLSSDSSLGRELRQISKRLMDNEVQGKLKLRPERPDCQIRFEVMEEAHDMIVIAAGFQNWMRHWFLGELIYPLLSWVKRPVLVAKSRIAEV